MNWAVFLLLNLIFFNLGFQHQSLGRFMLIEVNQQKDTSSKSETSTSDKIIGFELLK